MNDQALIKFQQNWSVREVIYYVQRSTNLLHLFGIGKACQNT